MFFKKASPVWAKDYISERNIMLSFVTTIPAFKAAQLAVTADNYYQLKINDEFICHGPARCGKGTWRVDNIEIGQYLSKETNRVELSVVHYGVRTFEYILQKPFLQAEITADGEVIAATGENNDFSVRLNLSKKQVVEKYSYQRGFLEVWSLPYRYSEELELIKVDNIKLIKRNSPYPDYKKETVFTEIANGTYHIEIPNEDKCRDRFEQTDVKDFSFNTDEFDCLYRLKLSGIKNDSFEKRNRKITSKDTLLLSEGDFALLELPAEKTGFISCDIFSESNGEVYFVYDEVLNNNDVSPYSPGNETTNLLPVSFKEGWHHFDSLEPMSFKYLKILSVSGEIKLSNLSVIAYENPLIDTAEFTCDDKEINLIWNAAVNTFDQNAVDLFTDCPSRERAGWLCDSFFTGRVEKDLTGKNDIEHDFLQNFLIATDIPGIPKEMLPMCYPSDTDSFIPNWEMFFVLELEEYVSRSGDSAMAEQARERLYSLENYFCRFINSDGLLENLSGWIFVEWSKANDWVQNVNFPTNMLYYAMLKAMSRLYGDEDLSVKADNIKKKIRELSYNGKFFRDHIVYGGDGKPITPNDVTEVCQYYAFFTGVADRKDYPELFDIILKDFGAGHKCLIKYPDVYPANAFIGNYLRLEVLSQFGFNDRIMNEIKDYFYNMARKTGTLWENDSTVASCNHGFASHIVHLIIRNCFGIKEIDEENKAIYLSEYKAAFKNAKITVPLKNGVLKVSVADGKRRVNLDGGYNYI